jgi:hypothetical protein
LAAVLGRETIGPEEAAGALLVIGGAYVGALRRTKPAAAPADPGGCVAAQIGKEPARTPEAAPAPARAG